MTPNSQSEADLCATEKDSVPQAPKITVLTEVKRFVVVGFINTVLDLLVLNFLIFLTHVGRNGLWFSVFKSISFSVAVANSYVINHSWTFDGRGGKRNLTQASQFLIVSLVGYVINVASASYVATFVPAIHGLESYWPSLAALVGTACGLTSNFLGYRHIVFSRRETASPEGTS